MTQTRGTIFSGKFHFLYAAHALSMYSDAALSRTAHWEDGSLASSCYDFYIRDTRA